VSNDNKARSEEGAIIVLAAVALFVIFSIVAVVIDTSIASAGMEQSRHYSRVAALAAIDEYFGQLRVTATTDIDAYDAAKKRVEKFSRHNKLVGDSAATSSFKVKGSSDPGASLIPGQWTATGCPGTPPCFKEIDRASLSATNRANAFRVEGEVFPNGIIAKLGSRFTGRTHFSNRSRATATLAPRHGCFLIDMSGSMAAETHTINQNFDLMTGQVSYTGYGYQLQTSPGFVAGNPPKRTDDAVWQWILDRGDRPAPVNQNLNKKVHYWHDYADVLTMGDSAFAHLGGTGSYTASNGKTYSFANFHPAPNGTVSFQGINYNFSNGSDEDQWIKIDKFRDETNSDVSQRYFGPEPLRTVFQGLSAALNEFIQRQVAGDMACIIFYDHGLRWNRTFKLTSNFDYLQRVTDFDRPQTNGVYDEIQSDDWSDAEITQTMLKAPGLPLTFRYGLFPTTSANTYTALAIKMAFNELDTIRNSTGVNSSDFVMLIGDGLTNCSTRNGTLFCENSYSNYQNSIGELKSVIAEHARDQSSIPIHVIAAGAQVQPYTKDIPDAKGVCVSDDYARIHPQSRTDPFGYLDSADCNQSSFDNMSSGGHFGCANRQHYELAVQTQGIYGPIRPARAKDADGNCPAIHCADTVQDSDDLVTVGDSIRRIKDPKCRTTEQQMVEYMTQVITDNPYTIVEVE